jgi:hypothetical protein
MIGCCTTHTAAQPTPRRPPRADGSHFLASGRLTPRVSQPLPLPSPLADSPQHRDTQTTCLAHVFGVLCRRFLSIVAFLHLCFPTTFRLSSSTRPARSLTPPTRHRARHAFPHPHTTGTSPSFPTPRATSTPRRSQLPASHVSIRSTRSAPAATLPPLNGGPAFPARRDLISLRLLPDPYSPPRVARRRPSTHQD